MISEGKLPSYSMILSPVDGSIAAKEASLHAIALAKLSGATVRAVHVLDETVARRAGVNIRQAMEEMRRQGAEALGAVERRAAAEGVHAETMLVEGVPGSTIVQLAETGGASVVVMGATGYRDLKQLLTKLGSVSEYVVQHAACPVLVVRTK